MKICSRETSFCPSNHLFSSLIIFVTDCSSFFLIRQDGNVKKIPSDPNYPTSCPTRRSAPRDRRRWTYPSGEQTPFRSRSLRKWVSEFRYFCFCKFNGAGKKNWFLWYGFFPTDSRHLYRVLLIINKKKRSDNEMRTIVRAATAFWNAHTCVNFKENAPGENRCVHEQWDQIESIKVLAEIGILFHFFAIDRRIQKK